MLMTVETFGSASLMLDTETDKFEVFEGEMLERAFDKLEDAQDVMWFKSVQIPEFDW